MDAEPNHYAAPSAEVPRTRRRPLDHLRLKYFYLASLFTPVVLSFIGMAVRPLMPLMGIGVLVVMLAGAVAYGLWLYRTWALVPEQQRRGTTPVAAVLYNFIPGVNVWWMFASNHRIARGLAETLAKHRTRVSAPTVLAWAGPALVSFGLAVVVIAVSGPHTSAPVTSSPAPPSMVTMFLPFLGLSPFLWFAWMARVDSCQQEIVFQRSEKKARRASGDDRATA